MRILLASIMLLLTGTTALAGDYTFCFGGGGGIVNLSGSNFFKYDWDRTYGFTIGYAPSDRWLLSADYSFYTLANDITADSNASLDDIPNNVLMDFEASRLGLAASRLLFDPERPLNLAAGLGGGVLFWKKVDPVTGQPFLTRGPAGQPAEFKASELFLTGLAGIVISPVPRLAFNIEFRADYLTHAGAEFQDDVKSALSRWSLSAGASLVFRFGGEGKAPVWRSDSSWSVQQTTPEVRSLSERDSDGDGVRDDRDRCQNTPRGIEVDRYGCGVDSDFDGVPDGFDDCPNTPNEARGRVDMFGCEVDSDFDGVPDYLDRCPANVVGAVVAANGCPIDTDGDGVPDGLDDCPHTLAGMDVDKFGCVDLAVFSRPMVLRIDYPSGSFEIDPNSKERIKQLASLLNFVTEIKLEIHGYSDNIGTTVANQQISEKRARRVKDFLVLQGVAAERMKVFGRGEENFIASNQTAEGRAQNRRIEIIFYK